MTHRHEYEPSYHPALTPEAKALGIKAAEIRKCKSCGHEMTFIFIKSDWVPLFEEKEADERDILLA